MLIQRLMYTLRGAAWMTQVNADIPYWWWNFSEGANGPWIDSVQSVNLSIGGGGSPQVSTQLTTYNPTNDSLSIGSTGLYNDGETMVNANLKIAPGVLPDFSATGFSVEWWMKPVGNGATYPCSVGGWDVGFGFHLSANGTFYCGTSGSNRFDAATDIINNTMTAGSWHHMVYTMTAAGAAKMYVNGVQVASKALTAPTAWAVEFGIDRVGFTGYCNGAFDEMIVYDHVLAPGRVLAHYTAGTGG
jgi:hypothetical protein